MFASDSLSVREAMFSISLISRWRCARSFSISSKTSSGERMVQSFDRALPDNVCRLDIAVSEEATRMQGLAG
jgi:hypothetical protein